MSMAVIGLMWALAPDTAALENSNEADDRSRGAFTCDFNLPPDFDPLQIGPVIERDRMYMAARPGMLHKHIPINFDPDSGEILTGGRYLFDTARHARKYKDWVVNSFILDGILFFDRPYVRDPECHAWSVIGAHDFRDIHTAQTVLRTERWEVPRASQRRVLKQKFNAILAEAQVRGLTSVWLLYNKDEALVSLVYFGDRAAPSAPTKADFASLEALAEAPPLGEIFDDQGWTQTFDRTQWTLTIWFPFALGDRGEPALWPNSPPFPQPSLGDGVCEVSRGESYTNSPECLPTCGDGIAQTGENSLNCPGDVRLFPR
jgi:hypothetical protein